MDDTRDRRERADGKRPYHAPRIQEVPLRPEEAVLGGCKTPSISGPAQFRCGIPVKCSALQS